jgi:magnesium transporter
MIRSFVFSEGRLVGRDLEAEAMRLVRADKGLHLWVDLENPTPAEIERVLGTVFSFHPVAVEDCVAPVSLPKCDDYDDYLFLVTQAVDFSRTDKFTVTQLNFFLGREYLVTFHRLPLRSVQQFIERCTRTSGIVARGPDRLAHGLLDGLVDLYQPVLQELRDEIEEIEAIVLREQRADLLENLLSARADLARLRQIVRPQRDLAARLAHGEHRVVRATLLPYFRDLRDNLARLEETANALSEQLLLCFDLYLNKAASEASDSIKVLTALTAITLPPIVIGTWYGMNFEHMPELASPWGYPLAFIAMLLGSAGMAWWCHRRGWL